MRRGQRRRLQESVDANDVPLPANMTFLTTDEPQLVCDEVLRAAGVPLAKKPGPQQSEVFQEAGSIPTGRRKSAPGKNLYSLIPLAALWECKDSRRVRRADAVT